MGLPDIEELIERSDAETEAIVEGYISDEIQRAATEYLDEQEEVIVRMWPEWVRDEIEFTS